MKRNHDIATVLADGEKPAGAEKIVKGEQKRNGRNGALKKFLMKYGSSK